MIRIKRRWYKMFKKTENESFLINAQKLYNGINQSLQNYHAKYYENIIEKSDNFKSLYKNVKIMSGAFEIKSFANNLDEIFINDSELCGNVC